MLKDNEGTFKAAFPRLKHVFLIAIHVNPTAHLTHSDIEDAFQAGADGILLIRDYMTPATNHDVLATYDRTRRRYPLHFVGVNLLGVSASEAALMIDHGTSGLWFDNARIDEDDPSSTIYLADTRSKSEIYHLPNPPLLMPSIAFKGQPPVKDFAKVVQMAQPFADALVTSGADTGVAPSTEKIRTMREACTIPFGIASGVSADNVEDFLELGVDFFIVNTSISNPTTGRLDLAKTKALRAKIPRH